VARKVVLHVPVRAPLQIYADYVVSHAVLTPFITAKPFTIFHVFQPTSIPSHLKACVVHQYDPPRKELQHNSTLTTEKIGFSIWHLIALGLFEKEVIDEFLVSLGEVSKDILATDIRETMSNLNDNFKEDIDKLGLDGLDWEEIKALIAYRNTFELCVQTKRPFLGAYTCDSTLIPPVVEALVNQTALKLGLKT
jgi:hypothetical protein